VFLSKLKIPYYLYYPRTTQPVLTSVLLDLYFFIVSTVCVPIIVMFYSRKFSRLETVGILAVWVAALILAMLGQPYAVPALYATVVLVAILNVLKSESRRFAAASFLLYTLAFLALIEFAALCYWAGAALNPLARAGTISEELEVNLTFSLYPIVVVMMFLLLFSWAWVPVVSRFTKLRSPVSVPSQHAAEGWTLRLAAVCLDLFVIVSILVFFYPYMAGQTWIIGVDSIVGYLSPLNELAGVTLSQAVFTSSRHGLYLFLLYVIQMATGASSFSIVKYAPLVLAFGTASVFFLAILRGGWSVGLAILASLSAVLWLPTALGMYAAIQANWFAYILWMLFLSIYFTKKKWSAVTFISQGLLSIAIFVVHPWTWGIFMLSLLLTAIMSRRTAWRSRCFQAVYAALITVLAVGIAAYGLLPGLTFDFISSIRLYALPIVQPTSLLSFGGAFVEMLLGWSSFLSPVLLVICLLGAYSLTGRKGIMKNYLVAWTATWCLGSFLVAPISYSALSPATSETQLWRILYLSPLPLFLALGMEKCLTLHEFSINSISQGASRYLPMLLSALLFVAGVGLFTFSNPIIRLAIVLAATVSLLALSTLYPRRQIAQILIASILILILVNAAYRSLYPLLLDPHNLLPPSGPAIPGK
jgi:hypothetical protein